MKSSKPLCYMLAMILVLAILPLPALAAPMDTRTLATINKPGVVLVQTTWTANMRLYEFSLDDSSLEAIADELVRMIENGQIPKDDSSIYSAYIQLIAINMADLAFYTGNVTDKQVSTWGLGTGFIVTPDGYLVTNAHVVKEDEDQLYQYFAVSNLQEQADADITEMLANMRRDGFEPSQDELDSLYSAYFALLAQSFEISDLQSSFSCFLGNVTPGSDVSAKAIGMDLRKIGEPMPGKDIAILKIDGSSNLPTVTLGDDTKMKTGDKVYAMGYPAVATVASPLNINQALQEPTLTQGIVSAKKQMAGGWNVIQMDADIHPGNSGGPLFNEAGEVIGVNTFGMLDSSGTGSMASGMNFAMPVSLAKQFLNEINITPGESAFTRHFKQALTEYNDGNYGAALELLRGINETNPGFPVVQELLAEAREAYDANPQPQVTPTPESSAQPATGNSGGTNASGGGTVEALSQGAKPAENSGKILGLPAIAVYVGGGVVLVAVILTLLLLTRKKKPAVAAAGGTMGYVAQASPPPQYQANVPQRFTPPQNPPSEAPLFCTGCGASLSPKAKFCDACGQPVKKPEPAQCPICHAALRSGAKFCDACGARVSGES